MFPIRLAGVCAVLLCLVTPASAGELPTEAEVRAVLPLWCKHRNEERQKLIREADTLFGIAPTAPAGKPVTVEMLAAHQDAIEKWKEPRLKALNDAFKTATGLDYYAANRVASQHRLWTQCR